MDNELPDVTLVVTTHNRPKYLQRLLTYLSAKAYSGLINVIDSSDESIFSENYKYINNANNIQHLRMPTNSSLVECFVYAINSVQTEYLCYCPDDDFIEPGYIYQATNFLRNNEDYAVCGSRFILAHQSDTAVRFGLQSSGRVTSEDPLHRFFDLYGSYWPLLRSVQRTKVAIDAANCLEPYAQHTAVGETAHGAVYALHGKIQILDMIGQIQVCHGANNLELDQAKNYLFCNQRFFNAVDLLKNIAFSRLSGERPKSEVDDWVELAVMQLMANYFWLWKSSSIQALKAMLQCQGKDLENPCIWMFKQLKKSLFEGIFKGSMPRMGDAIKDAFYHSFQSSFFAVDTNVVVTWSDSSSKSSHAVALEELFIVGDKDLTGDDMLVVEQLSLLREKLFSPSFVMDYECFKSMHIQEFQEALSDFSIVEDQLDNAFDLTFVLVILDSLSEYGRFRYDPSASLTEQLFAVQGEEFVESEFKLVGSLILQYPHFL